MSFELILPFLRPIEGLLLDENISEIMGNPDSTWWFEREGTLYRAQEVSFASEGLRTGLEVVANKLGKKLDEDNPVLNAQLPDGSRLAAVIPPVVRPAPAMVIRKFSSRRFTIEDLISRGTLTKDLASFLSEQVADGKTILISGGTGTGKTTALVVIRTAAETQGYQVEGFAPTSRAAKQLEQAGVHASTLQSFLVRSQDSDPQHRKFFFIDESSLASTNQMRDFLRRLGAEDRVLLVGDTRQHQAVEAGLPFQQLQDAGMQTAKLGQIVRQQDPALKAEVEMLAKGQTAHAIDSLKSRDRVQEIIDPYERIRTIARNYAANPAKALVVSPDNKSRQELNAAIREELKVTGMIGTEDHKFRVLVPRQDMTGAERAWAKRYELDDIVRFSRGSKLTEIEGGSYGKVAAVNAAENLLTLQKPDGNQITYDPKRVYGVTIYRPAERQFSPGDRIQFTAPDKELGVANRELGQIERIGRDGAVSLSLEDGRKIDFYAAAHPHFDHGYAVTSHSAQGLTADRVLINADTAAHPHLLNSRFAYVAVSRARIDAEIYTNNAAELGSRLSADLGKSSALDLSQPIDVSSAKDLGMGQSI